VDESVGITPDRLKALVAALIYLLPFVLLWIYVCFQIFKAGGIVRGLIFLIVSPFAFLAIGFFLMSIFPA